MLLLVAAGIRRTLWDTVGEIALLVAQEGLGSQPKGQLLRP